MTAPLVILSGPGKHNWCRALAARSVCVAVLVGQLLTCRFAIAQTAQQGPTLDQVQRQAADQLHMIQNSALGESTAPNRGRGPRVVVHPQLENKQATGDQSNGSAPLESQQDPKAAMLRSSASRNATGSHRSIPESVVLPLPAEEVARQFAVRDDNGLISLMVRDGSLRQVVSLIAETQKLNLVFTGADDVQVTATFDRIPWQRALEAVLSASGYSSVLSDNVIFVSSLADADALQIDAGGRAVRVFELDFAAAVDVNLGVSGLLSPGGKSWVLETNALDNRRTREAVVVVDYPVYITRIEDFISQSDQPPRQVLIEAHILQVNLSDSCRNGVNFEDLVGLGSGNLSLRTTGFASPAAPSFLVESTGKALTGLVELLQQTNDAKTLASPSIHAVNGQESRIQIGKQLGFRVTTTTQTSTLESVQFLDVGVVLRVTPRITRDGRVLMRIKPEVSTGEIDPNTELPSEETTEVETDVMLRSGQGLVIGGLIQEKDINTQTKIPLLGDIPYAGVLFQKRSVERERTEIIVTLVPHVLPYSPVIQCRNDMQVQRTLDPLTQGALYAAPRPYEPKMSDPLTNPKQMCPLPRRFGVACEDEACATEDAGLDMSDTEPVRLPSVETLQEPNHVDLAYPASK